MPLQNVVAAVLFRFNIETMNFEVIIIGGAYNGLALGSTLASKSVSTCLIEKRKLVYEKKQGEPSRLLAIANESCEFLRKVNLCKDLSKLGQKINQIRVADDSSPLFLDFKPTDIELENFGYMVEEHALLKEMYENKSSKLTILEGVEVESIDQHSIKLSDGRKLNFELLVGADGRNSIVREAAEIETYDYNYNQHAIICDIKHELNHGGAAIENFMPNGPFAVLPKQGGYESSIVWTVESEMADTILSLNSKQVHEVLEEKFDGMCGHFSVISELKAFPLSLKHAKQYYNKNIVLVGDALHAIHPLAGQGLNLGLRDVEVLAELIVKQKKLGLSINSSVMLEQYKALREADNLAMIEGTHRLNLLFSNNFLPLKVLRRLGLGLVNKLPFLKKRFMKYAVGE